MTEKKGTQGFASMDPEMRRKICSMGGKAAHAKGTAHRYTSAEAKIHGATGGRATAKSKRLELEGR